MRNELFTSWSAISLHLCCFISYPLDRQFPQMMKRNSDEMPVGAELARPGKHGDIGPSKLGPYEISGLSPH